MSDCLIYNIPVSMLGAYRGRALIVRSRDSAEIVEALAGEALETVSYVQILTLRTDLDPLRLWGETLPVDLRVENPEADLPLLYECSPLLARRPVRITVPIVPGFAKAVKLAVSLNFAVKLDVVMQPGASLVEEMFRVLDAYLHQPMVSQPIEFFHSLFLALFRGEAVTLWDIQEEDPARNRYVMESGEEALCGRFTGAPVPQDLAHFPQAFRAQLVASGGECSRCEFLEACSGYFKWPGHAYRCDGLRSLFRALEDAARQLKGDLDRFRSTRGGDRS